MDTKNEIKGFCEDKTTMRALSDGVQLLKRHAGMLLWVMCPLLVVVAAISAWLVVDLQDVINALLLDSADAYAIVQLAKPMVLPAILLVVFGTLLLAQFYSLFQGYVANGFIPQTSLKTCWKPMLATLRSKTLLVYLWILFVLVFYIACMGALAMVSAYTVIVTFPLAIWVAFWYNNLLVDFHVNQGSLLRAITRSARITTRGFLTFISSASLLGIVVAAVGLIAMIPTVICMVISGQAFVSAAMENGQDLPGYFGAGFFISALITSLLLLIAKFVYLSCWSMLYGAVTVSINHKSSKKDQTSGSED